MPNNTVISITITGDGSTAISSLQNVEGRMKSLEITSSSVVSSIKSHYVAIAAAVTAAALAIERAQAYIKMAAQAEQSEQSFRQVAASYAINADKMIADLTRVTNATIDDSDMMQQAMKALSGGMKAEDVVRTAEMARMASRRMGEDVSVAWKNITDAIETGQARQLRAYGLVTKEQARLIESAQKAGMEVDIMRVASLNATIQTAAMGTMTKTLSEKLQQLNAQAQQTKEYIGFKLVEGIRYAIAAMHLGAQASLGLAQGFNYVALAVAKLGAHSPVESIRKKFEDDAKAIEETIRNLAGARERINELTYNILNPPPAGVSRDRSAIEDAKRQLKELMDQMRAFAGAAEAKRATDELNAAMRSWESRIESLNPNLDQTHRHILQLQKDAADLTARFGNNAWIDQGLQRGIGALMQKSLDTEYQAFVDSRIKMREAQYEVDQEISTAMLTENQRRLRDQDIWANKMILAQNKYLIQGLIDLEQFEAKSVEITQAAEQRKLEIRQEYVEKTLLEEARLHQQLQEMEAAGVRAAIAGSAGAQAAGISGYLGNIIDMGQGYDPYAQQIAKLQEFKEARWRVTEEIQVGEMELWDAFWALKAGKEAEWEAYETQQKQQQLWQQVSMAENSFGMLSGLANAFYQASGQRNRAAFEAYKAFAIAETIISTIKAAQHSYDWGAQIGGPPLGAVMAALAVAAGYARVSQIANTEMGNTSGQGAGYSGSYGSNTSPSSKTAATAQETNGEKQETRPLVVNINIMGNMVGNQEYARQLAEELRRAVRANA